MSKSQIQKGINTLQNLNLNIKLIEYKNSKTKAKFQCLKCGGVFELKPESFKARDGRCPYCENKKADNKKISVAELYPDLIDWFVNKEDAELYGPTSKKYVKFKCPDCGFEFEEKVRTFVKRANHCLNCKADGISKPNKFLREVLREVGDQLVQKNFEWNPDWAKKYLYDGHIITKNRDEVAIEMQGEQHYHETNWGRFEYQIKRDQEKASLIQHQGIKMIEIECKNTSYFYMRNQILNSYLSEILDLSKVDWDKIVSICSKNYLKIVSDYYKNGLSTIEIGKKMDFDRHTIQRMLMDASEMGWVQYNPLSAVELSKQKVKMTDFLTKEEFVFDSVSETIKEMKNKYNIVIGKDTIGNYNKGFYKNKRNNKIISLKRKLYKNRFKFEYVEKNVTRDKANDQQLSS